jgi:hypothetical protein
MKGREALYPILIQAGFEAGVELAGPCGCFASVGMTERRDTGEVQVADDRITTRSVAIDSGEFVEREANVRRPPLDTLILIRYLLFFGTALWWARGHVDNDVPPIRKQGQSSVICVGKGGNDVPMAGKIFKLRGVNAAYCSHAMRKDDQWTAAQSFRKRRTVDGMSSDAARLDEWGSGTEQITHARISKSGLEPYQINVFGKRTVGCRCGIPNIHHDFAESMIGRERLDAGTVHEVNRFSPDWKWTSWIREEIGILFIFCMNERNKCHSQQERQQDSGTRKSTMEQRVFSGRWA